MIINRKSFKASLLSIIVVLSLLISGCGENFYQGRYNEEIEKYAALETAYDTCRQEREDLRVEVSGLRASVENGMMEGEEKKALENKAQKLSNEEQRINSERDKLLDYNDKLRDDSFKCGEQAGIATQAVKQNEIYAAQVENLRDELSGARFWTWLSGGIDFVLLTFLFVKFFPEISSIFSKLAGDKEKDIVDASLIDNSDSGDNKSGSNKALSDKRQQLLNPGKDSDNTDDAWK